MRRQTGTGVQGLPPFHVPALAVLQRRTQPKSYQTVFRSVTGVPQVSM